MDCYTLLLLASVVVTCTAWSTPYHSFDRPLRVTRFAPLPPQHRIPIPIRFERWQRPKRGHDNEHEAYDHGYRGRDHEHKDYDHDYRERDHDHKDTSGVTGPVHTFVKTDKNANYKWGVRHHVGNKYAS